MTRAVARSRLVRTFMTHDMLDEDILALATGRDTELARIIADIERSVRATPGTLQHVVVYGARGFGKSFMMRRVQVELEHPRAGKQVVFILLPEEQHNLQKSPYAFLETLMLRIQDIIGGTDLSFTEGHFRWPRPNEEAIRWAEYSAKLETALDKLLSDGQGLVVVAVENFDTLLQTLFREEPDEQRLRQWLDRPKNRLMLVATATGTVDIDYERPLFKAFDSVRLLPWTEEECIAYFNRQRAREGKPPLNSSQTAKARAVAAYIGGTPRLAQVLADVLDNQDALSVVETMTALTDRLAEYYRRRIEDLSPLSRGLLDALIKGGEPASQTELAGRVGARGQSEIARVMADLQRTDIIRGSRSPDSRETLYKVTDRVFVHYYRSRQGSEAVRRTPLASILDFLRAFYSKDEQTAQALFHLDAGRVSEAGLFYRLAQEGSEPTEDGYTRHFERRLAAYCSTEVGAGDIDVQAIVATLRDRPEVAYAQYLGTEVDGSDLSAISCVIRAQAMYRIGHPDRAKSTLEQGRAAAKEPSAQVILSIEFGRYSSYAEKHASSAVTIAAELNELEPGAIPGRLDAERLRFIAWTFGSSEMLSETVPVCERAIRFARQVNDKVLLQSILRCYSTVLRKLERYSEAEAFALELVALAQSRENARGEGRALRELGAILSEDGRFEQAAEHLARAVEVATAAGDSDTLFRSLQRQAWCFGNVERTQDAAVASGRAADVALAAGQVSHGVLSLGLEALWLLQLGSIKEARVPAARAIEISRQTEDMRLKAQSLHVLCFVQKEAEEWEAALETANLALDLARAVEDYKLTLQVASQKTSILYEAKRYEEALESILSVEGLVRDAGDRQSEANLLIRRSEVLEVMKRPDEALLAAELAEQIAQSSADTELQASSLSNLASLLGQLSRYEEASVLLQRLVELPHSTSLTRRSWVYGYLAFCLIQLGRNEEALESARAALHLARECGDLGRCVLAQHQIASSLRNLGRMAEADAVDAESLQMARSVNDEVSLVVLMVRFIANAVERPNLDVLAQFEELVRCWRLADLPDRLPHPAQAVPDLFLGAARIGALEALRKVLIQHHDLIVSGGRVWFYARHGEALAEMIAGKSRSEGYEFVEQVLIRISEFVSSLPETQQDETWLFDIASGFVSSYRGSGLLRDIAALAVERLGPKGAAVAFFLEAIANVDDAKDPEKVLARTDPDLATMVRRIRDLPEPVVKKSRSGSRNRRRAS